MGFNARIIASTLMIGLLSSGVALSVALAAGGDGDGGQPSAAKGGGEKLIQLAQSAKKKKSSEKTEEVSQTPPPAETGSTTRETAPEPDAWAVNCTNQIGSKFQCEMSQSIVDQKSRMQVIFISIKNVSASSPGAMLFRVFHGVYLPAGMNVTVDKTHSSPIQFQKSDQYGAYAALPLDDKWLAELRKGKEMKLAIQVNQGETLEILARLNGFGKAYDKVKTIE